MADTLYNRFKRMLADGSLDWDSSSIVIRALLVDSTSTYSPNPDHTFLSDLTSNGLVELDTDNYTRQTVTGRAVTQDDTNNRAILDASDLSWASLGPEIDGPVIEALVIYLQVGGDDTTPNDDVVIGYYDSGFPVQTNGGTFNAAVNTAGLATL